MPRLYRPFIPVEVRCRVVLRQLGEMWPDEVINGTRGSLRVLLDDQLEKLAALLSCAVKDLRLDHDPPLGARPRFISGLGKTRYVPSANDPEHLIYRDKRAHDVKTRIRGEHGQYSDLALIKRERRRQKPNNKPKRKWGSRPLRSASRWPKRKIERKR